jgi:hypothetical protein
MTIAGLVATLAGPGIRGQTTEERTRGTETLNKWGTSTDPTRVLRQAGMGSTATALTLDR